MNAFDVSQGWTWWPINVRDHCDKMMRMSSPRHQPIQPPYSWTSRLSAASLLLNQQTTCGPVPWLYRTSVDDINNSGLDGPPPIWRWAESHDPFLKWMGLQRKIWRKHLYSKNHPILTDLAFIWVCKKRQWLGLYSPCISQNHLRDLHKSGNTVLFTQTHSDIRREHPNKELVYKTQLQISPL